MAIYIIIGLLVSFALLGGLSQAPLSKERRDMAVRAAEESYKNRS